jgi:membrane protein DedA with SNARE-associated domain
MRARAANDDVVGPGVAGACAAHVGCWVIYGGGRRLHDLTIRRREFCANACDIDEVAREALVPM